MNRETQRTMKSIIAVINQKGGVGKSTTAAAITAGLTLTGFKVLAIDLDAQRNLTYAMGGRSDGATVLGVLLRETTTDAAIQHTKAGDLIAASKSLAGADAYLNDTGKEYRLKEALEAVKNKYDYVVIDTPPALGILTVNALTTATSVIIPAQADVFSFQGIEQLGNTIDPVKKYYNHDLKITGVLITRYSQRATLSREMKELIDRLAARLGTTLFNTTIREAIAVKEAQVNQESLFEYAPKAKVTDDYRAFIEELREREATAK